LPQWLNDRDGGKSGGESGVRSGLQGKNSLRKITKLLKLMVDLEGSNPTLSAILSQLDSMACCSKWNS
jgi:hypothetical protein